MSRLRQGRIFLCFFFLLFYITGFTQDNCFTILIGKEATSDGSVLLAHNEDDRGDTLFVNVYKIPQLTHSGNDLIHLKNGGMLSQINHTFGFLWLQIPQVEFGDSFVNEKGVVITSNACPSKEDRAELSYGGIGFMLRRILAQRAKSARDAVEIAGKLINRFGYYSSGRTYAIADSKEAWVLHVVMGKHWIAQRVPDSHAVVISNRFIIKDVNLEDKQNFLGSPDIIEYAVKRGWFNPNEKKAFNFAEVYSSASNYNAERNILRQWRGIGFLAKTRFKLDEPLPFSFQSKKDIDPNFLFRILRDHYEGTEYDLSNDYKEGSPNRTSKRTICTDSTQYAFVAHLREEQPELPKEIAYLVWISYRRPDSNAFSPWYVSINSPPEGYCSEPYDLKSIDDPISLKVKPLLKQDIAFFSFSKLSQLVDQNYRIRIKYVRREWRNYENYLIKIRKKMEREFLYLLRNNRNVALKIITNYVRKWEYRKWFQATQLISGIEK